MHEGTPNQLDEHRDVIALTYTWRNCSLAAIEDPDLVSDQWAVTGVPNALWLRYGSKHYVDRWKQGLMLECSRDTFDPGAAAARRCVPAATSIFPTRSFMVVRATNCAMWCWGRTSPGGARNVFTAPTKTIGVSRLTVLTVHLASDLRLPRIITPVGR